VSGKRKIEAETQNFEIKNLQSAFRNPKSSPCCLLTSDLLGAPKL
jgi:hypothetical protein